MRKKSFAIVIVTFVMAAFICMISGFINMKLLYTKAGADIMLSDTFRSIKLTPFEQKLLYYYSTLPDGSKELIGVNADILKKVVYDNVYNALAENQKTGNTSAKAPMMIQKVLPKEKFLECYNAYYAVMNDIKYFPVAKDNVNNIFVSYEDSWGEKRTYGGDRHHEGTDIMSGNNEEGYFPVISMTDGVVEKKGWLELGGYRLGIRSPSGGYYYYAHLNSYADGIEEGKEIKAGSVIGTMGSTGYGEEGTSGKFDVHLHLGIYYGDDEISFNPYALLNICKDSMIEFAVVDN